MANAVLSEEKIQIKPEIVSSKITISNSEIQTEKETILKKIQKSVSMPGFRPGKSPVSIIRKKYEGSAFYEGFENLLKSRTNTLLSEQSPKALYYYYNFGNAVLQDDATDKTVDVIYMKEPQVDFEVKDRKLDLVKYTFNDRQKDIFSNIILLFNFLKESSVEKLSDYNSMFIITTELESKELLASEDEAQKRKAKIPFILHPYQFASYGFKDILPNETENLKEYSIEVDKWLTIIEKNFPGKKLGIVDYLKNIKDNNLTHIVLKVKDIQAYTNVEDFLNADRIKQIYNIENAALADLKAKINTDIDTVAAYFSGNENIKRGNAFVENLISIEIPDDFIGHLYKNYVKDEDKQYFSQAAFKTEITKNIENTVFGKILPTTFAPNNNYDAFASNVAKSFIVETLITQMHLFDEESTKMYIIQNLQNSDKNKENLLQNYHNRDSIFSFGENLSKDVQVNFITENINKPVNFSDFIGIEFSQFE